MMSAQTRDKIKSFTESHNSPTNSALIELDWPKFEMLLHLVELLVGSIPILHVDEAAGTANVTHINGQNLLHVEKSSQAKNTAIGELASQLETLLLAIRIHEVESFNWVHLPPNLRQHELSLALAKAGVSLDQFRRATALWTN
jgi:hypothetical protein